MSLVEPNKHAGEEIDFGKGGKFSHMGSGRLISQLRNVARHRDVDTRLADAALWRAFAVSLGSELDALARAAADLCATGRAAERQLAGLLAKGTWLDATTDLALARFDRVWAENGFAGFPAPSRPSREEMRAAAFGAAMRAQETAGFLRKGPAERAAARPNLGWLAVSGEDDLPAWPVNVGVTPHQQHRIDMTVLGLPMSIRYAVAGDLAGAERVALLIHGHGSRLEELDVIASRLAEAHGWAVIVPDLPGRGYSSAVDPGGVREAVGPRREHVAVSGVGVGVTADIDGLVFLEVFLGELVRRAMEEVGREPIVDLVAGGSMGGNLTLRLAESKPSWARRFAAWSPASLWTPRWLPASGLRVRPDQIEDHAESDLRWEYFQQTFVSDFGQQIANTWYRDDWPFKARSVAGGWAHHHEVYSPSFRRWHFMLAWEQLMFSHQAMEASGTPHYARIGGPLYLFAGDEDDHLGAGIKGAVLEYGKDKLTAVPGWCHAWKGAGHSLADEWPFAVAARLDTFARSF